MAEFMREKIADILMECENIPGLKSFTSKPKEVSIEEDPSFLIGYNSIIVRLRAGDDSTVIAKHAPPYMREFGEAVPFSETRAEIEMTSLQLFERYIPGYAPKPFFFSRKHNTTLMEDLVGYNTLYSQLFTGNVTKAVIGALAVQMAKQHRSTHKDNICSQEWAKLQELLSKCQPLSEELAKIHASHPYISDPQDEVAKQLKEIAEVRVFQNSKLNPLLEQYFEGYGRGKCLVHGDNHTINILVKGDDVKLIDHEFTHLGSCWLDVCKVLADLVVAYYYHLITENTNNQMACTMLDYSHHLVDTYIEHMFLGTDENSKFENVKDLARYTGCRLFSVICFGARRHLGTSQIQLMKASIRLLEQHHVVDSVAKLYSILALE